MVPTQSVADCFGKYLVLGFGVAFVTILLLSFAYWPSSQRERHNQPSYASPTESSTITKSDIDLLRSGNFRLVRSSGALGCDHEYIFQCYQTSFRVILAYESPKGSVQKGFLDQLDEAYAEVEPDVDLCDEIENRIETLLKSLIIPVVLRNATEVYHDGQSIDDLVNGRIYDLDLVTINCRPRVIVRNGGAPGKSLFSSLRASQVPAGLPSILAADLNIVEEVVENSIYNVQHGHSGTIMRCKLLGDSSRSQEYLQELSLFNRLRSVELELKVSQPLGLVIDACGVIWGFVCEYIDGENLAELDVDEHDIVLRKRWKTQLRDCLMQIRQAGVRSDDVPPNAVIVDNEDNLCIVDLGYGFADCRLTATEDEPDSYIPGDAVITKFLKLDWQPPLFWTKN